jgi:hypothetical protein
MINDDELVSVVSGNSFTQSPPTPLEEKSQDVLGDTYAAMTDSPSARNAIATTYRGYCSDTDTQSKQ